MAGYKSQIRHTPNAAGLLMIELPVIAQQYGAREKISPVIYEECVSLVMEKFGQIGVNEIREAYRLWVAGELNLGREVEMYGGQFNAAQLGRVLSAYSEYRRAAVYAYIRERDRILHEEAEAQKQQKAREDFERRFPLMLQEAKANRIHWRDVPNYWYHAAMDREMIVFDPGEAARIYELAKRITRADMARLPAESDTRSESAKAKLMHRAQYGSGFDEVSKTIARKITVHRKLLK